MSFVVDSPFLVAASPSSCMYIESVGFQTSSISFIVAKRGEWTVEPVFEGPVLSKFCVYHGSYRPEEDYVESVKRVDCAKGMYGFYCSSFFGNDVKAENLPKSDHECLGPMDHFYSANLALLANQDWGLFPLGAACLTPNSKYTGQLTVQKEKGEAVAVVVDFTCECEESEEERCSCDSFEDY